MSNTARMISTSSEPAAIHNAISMSIPPFATGSGKFHFKKLPFPSAPVSFQRTRLCAGARKHDHLHLQTAPRGSHRAATTGYHKISHDAIKNAFYRQESYCSRVEMWKFCKKLFFFIFTPYNRACLICAPPGMFPAL